ncbi:transmembrane protein 14C [Ischnura elegans]|uniref:transmembrane protein 14C n=1 Tax=Ischnura elegans TaxID=197161 RepID=UPI001ED8B86F|nr:transmembrane protein 14C [Ischnura elegans]
MGLDLIGFGYAATIAAGGIMGYVKAGSVPSLGAGLLFGSILCAGAYLTSQNPNNYYLSLGTSAVLAGVMGSRFYSSGKVMPGFVAGISLLMVIRYGARGLGLVPVKSD